jgi:cell division control protein 7
MAAVRPRNAKAAFEIHNDDIPGEESMEEDDLGVGEERDEDDEDLREDGSETSDDGEETVDSTVQEDMIKFEQTFKGITERFRLINRIGEGQ